MTRKQVLELCKAEGVRFLRLTFTDIDGIIKNVEVPATQFEKALDGQIMFDGSSIEGFTRIEESDMLLKPDPATFCHLPVGHPVRQGGAAHLRRLQRDETPFAGCPRLTLKRIVERAGKRGWTMMAGPEAEFFLFHRDPDGRPNHEVHDVGGYFDLTPVDLGEEARRDIVEVLESMGFEVEAAHHEVAPGQHEIDFKYTDAISTADNIVTFRFVVKKVAKDHGLHATFMPKPIYGVNGSGMHTHQSLFDRKGSNVFYDPKGPHQLSKVARGYIAGHPRPRPRLRGRDQPAGELVQAPGSRARGARQRRVVGEEPVPAGPCAGAARNRHALRGAHARPGLQPVPGARRDAGERASTGSSAASTAASRSTATSSRCRSARSGASASRQLPANLSEALDNLERDKVVMAALGRAHRLQLRAQQARGVAPLHLHRAPLGARPVPRGVLTQPEPRERVGPATRKPSPSRGRSNQRPRQGSADHHP